MGSKVWGAEALPTDGRQFPMPISHDLAGGVSYRFQVFGTLECLVELTHHFPDQREHFVRYFGWYSYR